ncbi:MAG: DNA polymerase III subunit alpha, partial [Clostridiales Family XIII bacterium]|nr:DNA polymerase III subunit alpha [Clostridiales Family XIII bacterium]
LEFRYGAEKEKYRERLDFEFSVIENMGFIEYFLIVWDFINYAKQNGIAVGPGRGSAAGSIVAYTLKITDIDPIKYNLLFERFLNPERVSMPDIDIDFCVDRRGEVIEYVNNKYGEEKVCQIVTFGTMKAKMALRDVGRVLDIPLSEVNMIVKLVPDDLKMTLTKALEQVAELRELVNGDARYRELFDIALDLEGTSRNTGTHAAGVVICKTALDDVVPMYYSQKKGLSTQFTMTRVEQLGLLKMDFLGLRNLTVIEDAKRQIKKNHGVDIDFQGMEYNDPAVFELISSGDTDGVFQLESSGMKSFMKELKPNCFEDIIAGISLYRPGPMDNIPTYIKNKQHPDRIPYLDDKLIKILDVTYGVMVYQEQVMQVVQDLGGFTLGEADNVRRAMSKKKFDVMEKARTQFNAGCADNGISEKVSNEIYDMLIEFANYGFNKSHAAAYAVVSYYTAYLKVHYKEEFMAALMTSFTNDSTQVAKYINNCRSGGIDVLPPCVVTGDKRFSAPEGKIVYGMLGVKNVGEPAIDAIIEAREKLEDSGKKLTTLKDLIANVDLDRVNKRAIESLILAGAMDRLEGNRAQKMSIYQLLLDREKTARDKQPAGQISMFDLHEDEMSKTDELILLPDVKEFQPKDLLGYEKDMLGIYVSGHPLDQYKEVIDKVSNVTTYDIMPKTVEDDEPQDELAISLVRNGMKTSMVGLITEVKQIMTKKGDPMAFVTFEDLYGPIEVVVFPKTFATCKSVLEKDAIVVLRGKLENSDDVPKILASKITSVNVAVDYYKKQAQINNMAKSA